MEKVKFFMTVLLSIAVIMGGCAKEAKQTGFLSTYKNLEPVSSTTMRYFAPEDTIRQYSKFIIEPITVKFYDTKTAQNTSPEDIKHLKQYFYDEIIKAKPDRYEIVTAPGPGVARIRIAVTNIQKSTPALNVLPQTKLTGAGLGQASVEMEALDSQTGKQLAAAIDSQTGSRFSLSGLSAWGDVEAVMRDWAKRLWKRVDQAHGIEQGELTFK